MAGSTTVLNHAGSTPSGTNQNGFSLGSNGNGRAEPSKGGKRPLPHIDDIVSVKIDIDANASVERVIQTAEGHLRLAESSRTFGRPDTALKEYIMASLILVDAIKRNQGWVLLQDNRTQLDRYQRALRQVRVLQDDYEKIKADIKADNLRTSVQPTVSKHASSGGGPGEPAGGIRNGVRVGQGDVNGGADARKNGVPDRSGPLQSRTKPTVQPKPQALHGNVLHTTGPGASPGKTPEDLAQRFARLRASAPVQDPRIRTQTVIPPNSQSSQAMIEPPVSSSGSAGSAGSAGGMPRLPDAIYNPARGTISNEAAELPSSAPRAMFTRTNSTTSISNVIKTPKAGPMEEYFVPANTYTASMAPLKRAKLTIPEGNTISAQDLVQYMGMGAKDVSVLLIDIRNRESFDEGHIMSQATICLEADVLMRQDISANEIADSNVLAPPDEMILFDKRHQFDLVVFYDQESDRITGKRDTPEQKAISGLYNALTQYDFPASLVKKTTTPKLLEGGLEAWSNLVGRGGLQTSSTSAAKNPRTSTPMTRSLLNKRPTYITRPIQDAEEARKWEETIADLGAMAPIRTTEDFLRRVPAISTIQESMVASPPTSPLSRPASPFYPRLSQEEIFYKNLPSPPTRPPPTLPRRSHSGLVDTEGGSGTLKKTLAKSNVEGARKYRTGLQNTGVICFANSSLQAMFATPGFSRELWSGQWTKSFGHPPQKPDEKIPNSQLLTRMLAAQFDFLSKGECPDVGTGVLMRYVKRIHSKTSDGRTRPKGEIFGGDNQQDAQEFYSFIMDNIHDETNMLRDRKRPKDEKQYTQKDGTIIQNAIAYWSDYSAASSSIVDKYFRGLDVFISECKNSKCGHIVRQFQPSDLCVLSIAGAPDPVNLDQLIRRHQQREELPDLLCETCNQRGRTRLTKFARLPDRLAFSLNRFHHTGGTGRGAANKIHTKVRFPIRNLDLTQYCLEADRRTPETNDPHFVGPMRYDCYAVTVHQGGGIGSGHYFTYVENDQSRDPTDWYRCNDTRVDPVKIGSRLPDDQTEIMYADGNTSAYMVYYRRQGT